MTEEKKRSRLSRSRSRSAVVTETDADTKKAKVTRGDTRQKLIDAALQRIDSERHGMVGLSLREVTKLAGVSPTAFYRHFTDLEELGLAVLEESSDGLRRLLRDVRKNGKSPEMISKSTALFVNNVLENRASWLLLARERVGGSARIRAAIRNQTSYFVTELASDLRLMNALPHMTQSDLQRVASIVISLAINLVPDILDLPTNKPREITDIVAEMNSQLAILILGAINWDDAAANPDTKPDK
jgi:AcrR family transcriptional regulator